MKNRLHRLAHDGADLAVAEVGGEEFEGFDAAQPLHRQRGQIHPPLVRHFQEQQIRDLLDVIAVVNAIVPQSMAKASEFLDDTGHCVSFASTIFCKIKLILCVRRICERRSNNWRLLSDRAIHGIHQPSSGNVSSRSYSTKIAEYYIGPTKFVHICLVFFRPQPNFFFGF